MKSFTFHSYKGGTGKTFMSTSMALLYAKRGSKVCLLDFDFRAPSLNALFDIPRPGCTLNQLVDGQCEVDSAITDATKEFSLPGKLYVGFADSSTEAIGEVTAKDRKWQMKSLRFINRSLQTLSDKLELDYVIFDSSPGFQYSSINAVLSSDVAVLVTTPDKADISGTSELIRGVYETLERRTGIILNKVPAGGPSMNLDPRTAEKFSSNFKLPIIGVIPCSCEIVTQSGESFFLLEHPDHPIVNILNSTADKLEKF